MASLMTMPDEVINCIATEKLPLRHICLMLLSNWQFVRVLKRCMPRRKPNTEGVLAASQAFFAGLAFSDRGVAHTRTMFIRDVPRSVGIYPARDICVLEIKPRSEASSIFINYMNLVKSGHPLVCKISEESCIHLLSNGRWLIRSKKGSEFGFWRLFWTIQL